MLEMSETFKLQPLEIEEYTLDNGLRVVLNKDDAVPVVSLALYYNVGSRNEREDRTGFAHLFEHMMFQGSENVPKAGHFQHIMKAGGTMNGTTSSERTNYYETLPANQLPLALWLESDRMRSLAVTQENLDNQREAVKEEKRLRYDNQPYGQIFDLINLVPGGRIRQRPLNFLPIKSISVPSLGTDLRMAIVPSSTRSTRPRFPLISPSNVK